MRLIGAMPDGVYHLSPRGYLSGLCGLFRHPTPRLRCWGMDPQLSPSQASRGADPPRFASPAELECAKVLDYYGIAWEYEPRTFVLEQDEAGRGLEAFTPDFYLPQQ